MKKLLSVLMFAMTAVPWATAATVKISNLTPGGRGAFGIIDAHGTRIGSGGGAGLIGRMSLTESEVADLLSEGNLQAVYDGFEPFGPDGANPFALNSLEQDGAFEASISQSTLGNAFAGSPIYIWLYKGANRLSATQLLLVKLGQNFPIDTEAPPETLEVFLRPDAVFLAGDANGTPHDYQLPEGDGPQPTLKMKVYTAINESPVAIAMNASVQRGKGVADTLTATDAEGAELTFEAVAQPTKGTVEIAANGSFTYNSAEGTEGNDSFSFRAFDGISYSEPAVVTVWVKDPEAPSIEIQTLASGFVGAYYEYQIPIANLPQGEAISFAARGLPGGLEINEATGLITGYPSAVVTNKSVLLTAENAQGNSIASVTITINPVPLGVVGTYIARVERHAGLNDGLGGRLDLTTNAKGSFTAKLQVGTVVYTGKGRLAVTGADPENPTVRVSIDFVKKGLPSLTASLELDPTLESTQNFQVTGSLTDEADGSDGAALDGVRHTWTRAAQADTYKGNYTYGLGIPLESVNVTTIPQGYGYGTLTVTKNGLATFKGKTADGRAFLVTSIVGPKGHMPFFSSVTASPGSLVAMPQIVVPGLPSETEVNSLSGIVSWSKTAATVRSKERAYRAGFVPQNLALRGGLYLQPAAGGVVAGLPDNGAADTQPNARLLFADGDLNMDAVVPPFDFTIMNKSDKGIKQTVIVAKPNPKDSLNNPNPNSITFKLRAKPAGYFAGTFTLPHETKSLIRKAKYEGTFVRQADGSFERIGFFLLPELPITGGKLNTTPLHSGSVEVDSPDTF
jgi:hypothetical protein